MAFVSATFTLHDLRDTAAIAGAIRRHHCRAVLHFAAFAYVGESVIDPAKYYDNNVTGTLSLLAGMRAAECDALADVYADIKRVALALRDPDAGDALLGDIKRRLDAVAARVAGHARPRVAFIERPTPRASQEIENRNFAFPSSRLCLKRCE